MNGPSAPLSPVSLGGSEWSGVSKYQSMADDNYSNRPRGASPSPPISGGPNGARDEWSLDPAHEALAARRLPFHRTIKCRHQPICKERERQEPSRGAHRSRLGDPLHCPSGLLKGRDGAKGKPPNKAQDKLLRLSAVQFLELSTDVFDELMRRQATARRPPGPGPDQGGPPPYLVPEPNFHPKRNQARQKLSSLGPPRFRDLATDVYCELEKRFPRFIHGDIPRPGSTISVRATPSRSGTPVNGPANGFPPRNQSRMRRPSDASSIRGMLPLQDPYSVPPSPGLPNGEYGRPLQKQFQSNTIVPNKSTMIEEDDDMNPDTEEDAPPSGPNTAGARTSGKSQESSNMTTEADKKLIEDYRTQVRDLEQKLESLEETMKKKDEDMSTALDTERARATAVELEKKELADLRLDLENKLAEAQGLNDNLKQELDRMRQEQEQMREEQDQMRDDHANEARQLRDELEELRQSSMASMAASQSASREPSDTEMQQENEQLRMALEEQQRVTDEARREAREFLKEMKMLSQQSNATWERQSELEKTIDSLEQEVRDWRNRYARTKTQLRNFRASSLGLTIEQDAGKYVKEKGFTEENGLVKDVHITKFQISIDELVQRSRSDNPDKVIDAMKHVVVSVRRITRDIDESGPSDEASVQQRAKLKSKVSSTANNFITASKNFAAAAGISPVSLLDAAASHLVAAVVELLRTVKIRATPAGELEDDDNGTITPVDSTGFFSPRTASVIQQEQQQPAPAPPQQDAIAPPRAFQGLGGVRASADSSAYSPMSSPRQSAGAYGRRPMSREANGMANGMGMGYMGLNNNRTLANGSRNSHDGSGDNPNEDLKIYLEDQTAILVQNIQNLVGSIRSDATIDQISSEIGGIAEVVGKVVAETERSGNGDLTARLATCRDRLLEAGDRGQDLASSDSSERDWKMWTQTLPPIAFEIARETKELVQRVDRLVLGGAADDFS